MFNHASGICAKMYYYKIKIVINNEIEKATIWRGDNPSVWIDMGTKSELLKKESWKPTVWFWGTQSFWGHKKKGFFQNVWIACLNHSNCLNSIVWIARPEPLVESWGLKIIPNESLWCVCCRGTIKTVIWALWKIVWIALVTLIFWIARLPPLQPFVWLNLGPANSSDKRSPDTKCSWITNVR